ncbi:BLUF domain-containing protein [Undibacterium sp. Di24W]|uniref:BLUF domain-containing protein n=1 Tax=Undibacterium sp. Di24W TaxID=3413033 RepID=UPI003BF13D01
MSLLQLIYASDLSGSNESELSTILSASVRNNEKNGITGMLVYKNGRFLQVLEGKKENVLETYGRIGKDPRHQSIVLLLKDAIESRDFKDWSMGFKKLLDSDLENFPKYVKYFNTTLKDVDIAARPSIALEILKVFSTH